VVAWTAKTDQGAVVVVLNCSAWPQTVAIDFRRHGLRSSNAATLMSSYAAAGKRAALDKLELPAYGAYIGIVK